MGVGSIYLLISYTDTHISILYSYKPAPWSEWPDPEMEDLCNLCRPAVPDSKWPRDWGSHSFPGRKPNIMHYLVHWLQDWDFMMQERTARQTLGNFNVKHSCHGLACQRQTAVTCHSISSHCVSPCVYKRQRAAGRVGATTAPISPTGYPLTSKG